jgi:hypothetical protein
MPIHDWTRVEAGVYHIFHQDWTLEIFRTLNRGILPPGYFAMADQRGSGPEPAVVALRLRGQAPTGGLAVADAPPRMQRIARGDAEKALYARKANRIVVHKGIGRIVAAIEVVSPGNKSGSHAVGSFVDKAVDFLENGIHFLLIDPFPTSPRDPDGLAHAIWAELEGEPLPGRPLTVASFDAGPPPTAYVEALAVTDEWPEAPLFLGPERYVNVPLEQTYRTSWGLTPAPIRELVAP